MNEEEKTLIFVKHYLEDDTGTFRITNEDIRTLYKIIKQEKEKNKKLETLSNNLAKAIKFMGTNSELTVEEICKIFSPEEIASDFDCFMERWEKSQCEENHLKDKVIDMMAKDLVKVPMNDYMSETKQEIARYMNRHLKEKKETIKQYYFKKAIDK